MVYLTNFCIDSICLNKYMHHLFQKLVPSVTKRILHFVQQILSFTNDQYNVKIVYTLPFISDIYLRYKFP